MPKLKVIGKIELEKPEPEVKEVEIPQPEPEVIPPIEGENEITRVETPTLKGLKILGKIDTNKFKEPSKKKEEPKKTTDTCLLYTSQFQEALMHATLN